jgi:hypothetical protein
MNTQAEDKEPEGPSGNDAEKERDFENFMTDGYSQPESEGTAEVRED